MIFCRLSLRLVSCVWKISMLILVCKITERTDRMLLFMFIVSCECFPNFVSISFIKFFNFLLHSICVTGISFVSIHIYFVFAGFSLSFFLNSYFTHFWIYLFTSVIHDHTVFNTMYLIHFEEKNWPSCRSSLSIVCSFCFGKFSNLIVGLWLSFVLYCEVTSN